MYNFQSAEKLLDLCSSHKLPISEITILYEINNSKSERHEVLEKMTRVYQVMQEAIQKGLKDKKSSSFGMASDNAKLSFKLLEKNQKTLLSPLAIKAMAYAIATGEHNCKMGRIVAFPTAGGSGVIPGSIIATQEEWELSEKKAINALFTATGIGLIIAKQSTFSAAKAGCQAEVGAATAMAAAALTEMRGGTPQQAINAAALALKNKLGLVCDPLGGLVAVPCIKRNGLGAVHALGASDLSIAGVKSFVPFDEVVQAMNNIGDLMSEKLKETALGGLATTKTGLKIREKMKLPKIKKR
ncbi:MAG: L-serine dehydratase, iron-sulfur-dependent, alpha subunit [Candidatus Peregrinibacteria bacterium GW2011_GWA2_33_10]|nr:MAG: L-serine dehydratase, iron-sulfur-dependent, alpha subunit [Candidatus Peregrinibacteria bacterium GW2011_GWA2_33_10]KKP39958.1 MAG: L-serine dehydratase, iron-sulfur-dependent subunit alpha, L-serine dehydratase [Candidatus Peregrinibacteria bacterium GW2011_GWC2_33_13]